MPTIRDVAQHAGVSTATVSATLNGTAFVSPALRERVLEAVRALGYAPDAIARSLKKGRTNLIGFVVSDVTNPFFNELTQVIESAAQTEGYSVLLCDTDQDFEKEQRYIRLMRSWRVDGLILIPSGRPDQYDSAAMLALRTPLVLVDRALSGLPFDSVTLNNRRAGQIATEHILEFGHRRVGAIIGPMDLSPARERAQGFRAALRRHGVKYDEDLVRDGRFREEEAFEAASDLLARKDRPTALFVANNHMLIGVMRAIAERGLTCPRDISIVSIDDFRWANAFTPRLTTVSQPVAEFGEAAVRLVIDRLSGSAPPEAVHRVMEPALVVRDSCSPYVARHARRS